MIGTVRSGLAEKRVEFDKTWGVYDDGVDEVQDLGNGDKLVKMRLVLMAIDTAKSYEVEENFMVISNVALEWLSRQPEASELGVPELYKNMLIKHRLGIAGGLGSPQQKHSEDALARIGPTVTFNALPAANRLATRTVQQFPSSRILEPPDQAATPEEIIEFCKQLPN